MNPKFNLSDLRGKFIQCLKDDRGQAMTEYLLISGIMIPLAVYLFHPDNGLFQTARDRHELTSFLISLPIP